MRIIDSHTHLVYHNPKKLLEMTEHFGYEKYAVMGIPCYCGPLNTLESLLTKRLAPERTYVYGGMVYIPGQQATADDHEKQLRLMMEAGCDGWKLLESKPSVYRELQLPLDGEVFAKAFAIAESERIPITWHSGDPATFWSAETAPAFAVENNWLCVGEGFPKLETLYTQVENVLDRHPALRVSMAHLYFTSDDRAHAERVLNAHPDFWLDLTPGSEMYHAFLADPEGWRAFFETYQDRLVFGTDMEDTDGDVVFSSQDAMVELVIGTLKDGLKLPEKVLEKILAANFERRVGAPRALNAAGLNAYVEYLLPRLSRQDQQRAQELLSSL